MAEDNTEKKKIFTDEQTREIKKLIEEQTNKLFEKQFRIKIGWQILAAVFVIAGIICSAFALVGITQGNYSSHEAWFSATAVSCFFLANAIKSNLG